LFWLSCATLYVEVMLIRWVGTEVRIFAYFQNLALIACFLGFGVGCYRSARRPANLDASLLAVAVLVLLVSLPLPAWKRFLESMSNVLALSPDGAIWSTELVYGAGASPFPLWVAALAALALFLELLVVAMIPLGQWVGACLDEATDTLRAYSVNLAGSMAGTWLLPALSFLWLPPEAWLVAAFALLALAAPISRRALAGAAAICAVALLAPRLVEPRDTYWSPYQKLDVQAAGDDTYQVNVNNAGYMSIANLTPELLARNPEMREFYRESGYDSPFRFAARVGRVLIVGAGAGNDVAAALRSQAEHVDAVEIDPLIYALGRRLHPERPYDSPRVTVLVNDARNFFLETTERYDVIVFGLLDSHTQFSGYTNMRVDNYVYTRESLARARALLAPGGLLVLKFEVREPWTWLGNRLHAMLEREFGRAPIVYHTPAKGSLLSATVFLASDDAALWSRAEEPALRDFLARHAPRFDLAAAAPLPTTDDWPYIYHREPSIPRAYLAVSLVLLVLTLLHVRGGFRPREASSWHFFALGAGFLLLETQMIGRLALYFGTTWLVNAIALSAVLAVLVASNVYVVRTRAHPPRLPLFYGLLIASLLANWWVDWSALGLGSLATGTALSLAYGFSVFCTGVIFAQSFERAPAKSTALGSNLVGAIAGGLLQNLSFVLGMKALLPLASVLYLSAAALGVLAARARR
jgi:spermidine synthase